MFVLSGRQINTVIQIAAMACDIMSIPISIVTSESAFSIGGDVLDQYRSSLKPNTVEAIMCRRDWLVGAAIGKLMSHLLINFCLFDFLRTLLFIIIIIFNVLNVDREKDIAQELDQVIQNMGSLSINKENNAQSSNLVALE